jgi:uroporphyrinogen-III synthase/nicotinamide riboside kinase
MTTDVKGHLRIAICGSASVGKTTLANAISSKLGLPCIREEMRDYLESTGRRLCTTDDAEAEQVLMNLWRERAATEALHASFVADNCSLDFAAYALHYGCLTVANSATLLAATADWAQHYDAVIVLPWGQILYVRDGVRCDNPYEELRYQLLIEGLLRRYVPTSKLRFMPDDITSVRERVAWLRSTVPELAGTECPANARRRSIAGEVVKLQVELGCFGHVPMSGFHVLVARARPGRSLIAQRFRELGATVTELPVISSGAPPSYEDLDRALCRQDQFDHVVFGCIAGTEGTADRINSLGIQRPISSVAIGAQIESELAARGLAAIHTIAGSCSDAVAKSRAFLSGKRLLLITSERGRPHLVETLSEAGAVVESVAAYGSQYCFDRLASIARNLDLIVLPSSSAARLLLAREEAAHLKSTRMIAIGPHTEAAASQYGATDVIRAKSDDVESIVSAALEQLTAESLL